MRASSHSPSDFSAFTVGPAMFLVAVIHLSLLDLFLTLYFGKHLTAIVQNYFRACMCFLSSIPSELCRFFNTTHCGWAFFMWVFHQPSPLSCMFYCSHSRCSKRFGWKRTYLRFHKRTNWRAETTFTNINRFSYWASKDERSASHFFLIGFLDTSRHS